MCCLSLVCGWRSFSCDFILMVPHSSSVHFRLQTMLNTIKDGSTTEQTVSPTCFSIYRRSTSVFFHYLYVMCFFLNQSSCLDLMKCSHPHLSHTSILSCTPASYPGVQGTLWTCSAFLHAQRLTCAAEWEARAVITLNIRLGLVCRSFLQFSWGLNNLYR